MSTEANNERKVGLLLPTWTTTSLRWSELFGIVEAAVEAGFDSLWAADHLLMPSTNREGRRRAGAAIGEDEIDEPEGYWEAFTVLSAIAGRYPGQIELGTLVAATSYRNPGLLAKIADTLDEISGGKFILGVGSGYSESEYRAFGYPHDNRISRFEEALHIIHGLLKQRYLDFEGRYYSVRQCRMVPTGGRPQGPPIMIGALSPGPRMLRLIARYADLWNGWLGYTNSYPEATPPMLDPVLEGCRVHGRDPATLGRTITVRAIVPGFGVDPGPHGRPLQGSLEELASAIRGHHAAGIQHVQVALVPGTVEAVRRFAPVLRLSRA